jgi:hypothetical protein
MYLHWPDLTSSQYDAVMAKLSLDSNPAAGAIFHMATATDQGLEICEVWQTEQAFNSFLEQRLLPVASNLGIRGEPTIWVGPLHNVFTADPIMLDRMGAVSLPATTSSWST